MGVVKIIITVVFLLFSASFLLTSFNAVQKPGTHGEKSAVVTFIFGTTLAALTYAMWAI